MKKYIVHVTKAKNEPKTKLTMANWKAIERLQLIPPEFAFTNRLIKYKTYVFIPENRDEELSGSSKTKGWYRLDRIAKAFFESSLRSEFTEVVDFKDEETIILSQKSFQKFLDKKLDTIKEWLLLPETVELFNKAMWNEYAQEIWSNQCVGNISKWEMDSLSFYYHTHELAWIDAAHYHLTSLSDIPEEPIIVGYTGKNQYPQFQTYTIVGTVLDKTPQRHMVTLLTPDGVITLKFYAAMFSQYDKQLSEVNEQTGKKTIMDKSWFLRGNKLIVTGYRRGEMFYPKRYSDTIAQHVLGLIKDVSSDGLTMNVIYER